MAAREHPAIVMPSVTVLQLETDFPRVPGDVGCPETYIDAVEIIRIPGATVGQIVTSNPAAIPVAPFEDALALAKGEVIVTSCGFLSYWQDHLAAQTDKPFISSALTALPTLCETMAAFDILTLTFDADSLNINHLGPITPDVVGLLTGDHLRRVIAQNRTQLDVALVSQQLNTLMQKVVKPNHRHLLLECTNLPPYKATLADATGLQITDILTCIEAVRPGTIAPQFL